MIREEPVPNVANNDAVRIELMKQRRADVNAVGRRQKIGREKDFWSRNHNLRIHCHRERTRRMLATTVAARASHRRGADRERVPLGGLQVIVNGPNGQSG